MNFPKPTDFSAQGRTFADRLEQYGDAVAIVTDGGEQLTYAELAARSDEFASLLSGQRQLLLIEAENDLAALVAYLGALRHRHPVLLASGENPAQLDRILATYSPDVRYRKAAGEWRIEHLRTSPKELHPDLALLLSTSGSTGAAKLVRVSYEAIDANAKSISEYLNIVSDDRAITTLPIHYSYGLSVIASHLLTGARILLTKHSILDTAFWSFAEDNHASSLAGVPYTYEMLERVSFRDKAPGSIKTLTQAGGKLPPALASTYALWAAERGIQFYVMYGQTEATARMAYVPPRLLAANPDCIGIAIPGGSFRLIDDLQEEISAPNAPGELVYSGPNVMLGYALTSDDLARGRDLAELRTGDLAVRTPEGLYKIVGRKSRFIKLFGLRLSLDETESLLEAEGIRAIATGDDDLLALAILSPDSTLSARDLVSTKLSIPSTAIDVKFYSSAPTLPSGKFDYPAILKAAKERAAASQPEGSNTIISIFEYTFPNQEVLPSHSFIDLGGDSLRYVRISIELEEILGELPDLWEELSIAELEALGPRPSRELRWWQLRTIESEVAIRAAAIMAVVVNHASTLTVGGGAHVLLMLSGYNFSKYQKSHLVSGTGTATLLSFIKNVIIPYYFIMIAYFAINMKFDAPSLLLISNLFGRSSNFLEPYWFLEVLLQIISIFVCLFLLPPVRRAAERAPWSFGLTLLAACIAIKVAAFAALGHHDLQDRTPDAVAYMFAFGWCLHQANTRLRRLTLTAIAVGIATLQVAGPDRLWDQFAFPSNISHSLWFVLSAGLILWWPRVSVPSWAHGVIALIAASSFYIYLTHGVPVHFFLYTLGWNNLAVILVTSALTGIVAYRAVDHFSRVANWTPPRVA